MDFKALDLAFRMLVCISNFFILMLTTNRIFLFLSLLSFAPQAYRLHQRGNSRGLSIHYVLLNLISTTQQFTLAYVEFPVQHCGNYDQNCPSPTPGDWVNFIQLGVTWLAWFGMFVRPFGVF